MRFDDIGHRRRAHLTNAAKPAYAQDARQTEEQVKAAVGPEAFKIMSERRNQTHKNAQTCQVNGFSWVSRRTAAPRRPV